jgi:hypothetical protein
MHLRRAADIRAGTVIAARADRSERALTELHRIDARIVARNGRGNGARNDTHHPGSAEVSRRAAVAEGEAALWRATAEVLLLDREIWLRARTPRCRYGPLQRRSLPSALRPLGLPPERL